MTTARLGTYDKGCIRRPDFRMQAEYVTRLISLTVKISYSKNVCVGIEKYMNM